MAALCGDETCDGPGCQQEAIDAWYARLEADARYVVRSALGLPVEVEREP